MFVPSFLCPYEPDRCSGAIGPRTERELLKRNTVEM